MKFSQLNPSILGGWTNNLLPEPLNRCHTIAFDCPICGRLVAIHALLNEPAQPLLAVWKWTFPPEANALNAYDLVSIEPSIQNHPVSRKEKPCPAHFTITKGEVILN